MHARVYACTCACEHKYVRLPMCVNARVNVCACIRAWCMVAGMEGVLLRGNWEEPHTHKKNAFVTTGGQQRTEKIPLRI